jgi:Ni,Fe-hydrogenase III small subunit
LALGEFALGIESLERFVWKEPRRRVPYVDHPEVHNGADSVVPVDLYVPGCPPHPLTVLDGLLRLVGRIEDQKR